VSEADENPVSSAFEADENSSLSAIREILGSSEFADLGSGDDAAVVRAADGRFVVTTDTMVENHDFKLEWSTAFQLGYKAAATNLADVAAMGARPTALVVALVVRSGLASGWLEDFARGLRSACDELAPGCGVVGGDLARGGEIVIAVTAHGSLEGRDAVVRAGARAGDVVAVAGTLGRAACGLSLLSHSNPELAAAYDELVSVQLSPRPPIALGVEAAEAGATAMLDLSDSLAKDAGRIARASNVRINLDSTRLLGYLAVLEGPASSMRSRDDNDTDHERNWVLFGGEDHSLLACFPADATLPRGFKVIGEVLGLANLSSQSPVTLDGEPLEERGWDSLLD
jgi:thiamine-monophosphate kinase